MKSRNILAYALTISLLLAPSKINNKEYRYLPPEKVKVSSQIDEEDKENNKNPKLVKTNTSYIRR